MVTHYNNKLVGPSPFIEPAPSALGPLDARSPQQTIGDLRDGPLPDVANWKIGAHDV